MVIGNSSSLSPGGGGGVMSHGSSTGHGLANGTLDSRQQHGITLSYGFLRPTIPMPSIVPV